MELQAEFGQARKIRVKKLGGNWKDFDRILYYQSLFYITKIIKTDLINKYYDNSLVSHFSIKEIQKLVSKKYY